MRGLFVSSTPEFNVIYTSELHPFTAREGTEPQLHSFVVSKKTATCHVCLKKVRTHVVCVAIAIMCSMGDSVSCRYGKGATTAPAARYSLTRT